MKYCPFCGVGLQDDMAFCPSCGKRFLNASAGVEEQNALKEAIEETTEKETAAQVVPVQVCPPVTQQPEQPRQKTKKRKWGLLIVCIAVIAALLMAGLLFFSDKVEKYCGSVLYLELYDDHDSVIGSASGFLIRDGRTLVTNYHVIDGTYHIVAQTADGNKSTVADTVLAYDEKLDLAVLQCEDDLGIPPIPVGDSGSVKQGDHVYAIGYPLGVANTLSEGVISSLYEDEGVLTIQTTAAISSGSSGGVLMNKRGEAIGVTAASYVDGQNLNLAIPIAYVEELMEKNADSEETELKKIYSPKLQEYSVDYVLNNYQSLTDEVFIVDGWVSIHSFVDFGDRWSGWMAIYGDLSEIPHSSDTTSNGQISIDEYENDEFKNIIAYADFEPYSSKLMLYFYPSSSAARALLNYPIKTFTHVQITGSVKTEYLEFGGVSIDIQNIEILP